MGNNICYDSMEVPISRRDHHRLIDDQKLIAGEGDMCRGDTMSDTKDSEAIRVMEALDAKTEFGNVPKYAVSVKGGYLYVCRNNGQFHRGGSSGVPGYATFLGRFTAQEAKTRFDIELDIDPRRPAYVSSSDAEKAAALEVAETIERDLTDAGWPPPVWADSGNGLHLLYRVDLPNDDDARDLIQAALVVVDVGYPTKAATVDQTPGGPTER